jgi:xylulokinase
MSDAAGTLWLDQAARTWSEQIVEASGVSLSMMPRLSEGSAAAGSVRPSIAAELGWAPGVRVAGGAGDAAAAAIGLGAINDGDAFISLGTSCQLFVTTAAYRPNPASLVHAFAHALPRRWFQMAAMLNGASCLAWIAEVLGRGDIYGLLREVAAAPSKPCQLLFLPYLAGERTPHNDAAARGVFFGLDAGTTAADLVRAVLEGVAFSIREARDVLELAGTALTRVGAAGGGARNSFWLQMIATITGLTIECFDGTAQGPAIGAARLGWMALTGQSADEVCPRPRVTAVIAPDPAKADGYASAYERYRSLYRALRPEFARGAPSVILRSSEGA